MGSMLAVLVLMGLALFLFVTELVRVDLVGMGLMVAIALLGLVPPEQAFAGFAHPALLTVAAMFVLAAGLNRTGALAFVADRLIRASRGGPLLLLLLLMITAAVMSAFINNTTVVVIMIPLVISLAQKFGTSPSRLLMPLSFASILGGTCTLIGTSTNLLVSGLAVDAGHAPLGMFELAPIGLAFTAVGITYMVLFGRFLLPDRRPVSAALQGSTHREYLTEIQVGSGSSLVGSTLAESVLSRHPDLAILQVVRGEQILWPPLDKVVIQAGDVLMSRGPVNTIVSVQSEDSLEILPELARGHLRFDPTAATLAEVVILPNSPLVGVQVGDARFRRLYRVTVMALQRRGAHFREDFPERSDDFNYHTLVSMDRFDETEMSRREVDMSIFEEGGEHKQWNSGQFQTYPQRQQFLRRGQKHHAHRRHENQSEKFAAMVEDLFLGHLDNHDVHYE